MRYKDHEVWKRYVAGAAGGAAGVVAMNYSMKLIQKVAGDGAPAGEHDMSLVGRQHRKNEPAPAALGRVAFRKVVGREPSEETTKKLGAGIHWAYGIEMAGLYGIARGHAGTKDVKAGLAFGAAMWALGDLAGVPLLGLGEGPKAYSWKAHATYLGAHLAYGVAAAVASQAADRALHKV